MLTLRELGASQQSIGPLAQTGVNMSEEMTQTQAENFNPFETPLYEELEPGTYPARITGVEFKTVDGKGKKLVWKMKVESGKGKGRNIYADFIQTWNNADTVAIGRQQYRRALAAVGLYSAADTKNKKVAQLVAEGTAEVVEVGPEGFPHTKAKGRMALVTIGKNKNGYTQVTKIEGVKPELGDVPTDSGDTPF